MDSSRTRYARSCESCGRPLSRYNDGSYCGACATPAATSGESAVTVPAGDDLGMRLRAARRRRGMSLAVLGGLCDLSASYLSMVENGKRRLDSYSLILALAAALGVPPADIAPGMPDSATPPARGRAEGAAAVLARVEKLRNGVVDPEIIDCAQRNVQHVVAEYEQLDHSVLEPAMLKQRAEIDTVLERCTQPKQRQQLLEVAGMTSGLLGYIAVGRSDFPLARAYCGEAFQLGEFTQRMDLQAWSRGLQSFCEYYSGRYDDALQLATDGLNYAQSGPQSVRLTINGAARALGKLGDTHGVHRAVGQAYDLLSRHDVPDGVPSSITFDCYSAAQTASNAATAYLSLGIPGKVQHYVGLALPEISKSDSPWSRSLVMIDLASSLIHPKEADLDRAAALMLDALNISSGRPIASVQLRTSEFLRRATSQWGNVPQLRTVRDAASSLTTR
jgi:transcriptional regulator with XRE-family HTH domain